MSPYNCKIIITHNLVSSIIFICNFQIHEFSRIKEFKNSIMLITNFVNLLRFLSVQYGIGIGLEALTTCFVQTRITVVKRISLEGRECALFETSRCSDVCQFLQILLNDEEHNCLLVNSQTMIDGCTFFRR